MYVKKVFKYTCWLLLAWFFGMGCFYGYLYFQEQTPVFMKLENKGDKRPLWVSDEPVPETVRPDYYLAALNATLEDDPIQAAKYYLATLKGDPDNAELLLKAYLSNAVLGNFEGIKPFVDKVPSRYETLFFTNYLKIAYAFREKNWQEVRNLIKQKKPIELDAIVTPLLDAWSYAGEGNYEKAMNAMEPLKKQEGVEAYYYYHKGLISIMFGKVFEADEAFQNMATQKLPSFSLYSEIRSFYVRQGSWSWKNNFFIQWQAYAAAQPATADLIMQVPAKGITAQRGAAEVFYNISTAMGSNLENYEIALILSAFSSYIDPDQNLPKIWSAEVLEQAKKPLLAAYFYDQLKGVNSQTIDFKKAMNLLACKRGDKAKPILLRLKQSNQQNISLWWALASMYQEEENWPAATDVYTHILKIIDKNDPKGVSNVYFARAYIYGEQNRNQEAEADLQRALELNPENSMLLNHLGYLWLENDEKMNKGADLVAKAYKLDPKDPHIIDSMAFAYYRQGKYREALPLAEKTVDIMPQSSVTNAHLGDIYEALGRHREAVFQYKKALSLKYDITPKLKKELEEKIARVEK